VERGVHMLQGDRQLSQGVVRALYLARDLGSLLRKPLYHVVCHTVTLRTTDDYIYLSVGAFAT